MIKIFGRVSSMNVRKVLWTLREIGLEFEQEDWGQGYKSTQTPDFLNMNPNGLVPVFKDGAYILWESNTICRYLARKHRREDLLPENPENQAGVEIWMDWCATNLNAAWNYSFMALVRKHPSYNSSIEINASIEEWNKHMSILEKQLSITGSYINGTSFTLADIALGLSINRWLKTPIDRVDCPGVIAYYEILKQRPSFSKYGYNEMP